MSKKIINFKHGEIPCPPVPFSLPSKGVDVSGPKQQWTDEGLAVDDPQLLIEITPQGLLSRNIERPRALETLTELEADEKHRWEAIIKKNKNSFWEACEALSAIWSKRLFRDEYRSFKDYCEKKWGFSRSYGYRMLNAHKTVEQVSTMVDTSDAITSGTQAKELKKVPEDKRAEVLKAAKKKAGLEKMTSRHIKEAAKEMMADVPEAPIQGPPKSKVQVQTCEESSAIAPSFSAEGKVWVQSPSQFFKKTIPTLAELSQKATTADNIRTNPVRKGDFERLLRELKFGLQFYAEWEAHELTGYKEAA